MSDFSNFKLTITCDNAAFGDNVGERGAEIARILRWAAARIECGSIGGTCRDQNGNRVGEFMFSPFKG